MLRNLKVTFGSDPEAFFSKDGKIIGCEKLVPKKGLKAKGGEITRDGVQFELHPEPGTLKALVSNVGDLIVATHELAQKGNAQVCYDGLVEVERAELDSLSKECRILGCQPSFNVYGERPINVDPVAYRKRSSGGHIHIGIAEKAIKDERRRLVPLMDILVGNTCVLLDRDPGAAERRENYGRAGECRFPRHGVEYRTTSNFWMRDPSLMLFVFGMAQSAVNLLAYTVNRNEKAWDALADRVNIANIKEAINHNNFGLALGNLNSIAPFLRDWMPKTSPLNKETIGDFIQFAITTQKNGLAATFDTAGIPTRWQNRDVTKRLV